MKYIIQSNKYYDSEDGNIEEGWYDFSERDDITKAIEAFANHINLARVIRPARLIDSDGKVYMQWDSEDDTRLPGCRWRIIQRNAYALWEAAGKPVSDGVEFWEAAEANLVESNGVTYFIPHEEFTKFVDKSENIQTEEKWKYQGILSFLKYRYGTGK